MKTFGKLILPLCSVCIIAILANSCKKNDNDNIDDPVPAPAGITVTIAGTVVDESNIPLGE